MNKKVFVITVILYLVTKLVYAQINYPEGILNLKWGDSIEKVKKTMLLQKGVELLKNEDGNKLIFLHGKLSDRKVEGWTYYFYKNQMCAVTVQFDISNMSEDEVLFDFNTLINILKDKYGLSERNPSEYSTLWKISAGRNEFIIQCSCKNYKTDELYFYLTYVNGKLSMLRKELIDKKASETFNKKDF